MAPLSGLVRLAALVPFVIATPAVSDLFESYDAYKQKWTEGNPPQHHR
ncbi:MAG TPA: hypothetical protein VI485_14040 [Vicinamibacterales bacterium]|nr:hypothetical protein [Vicinamibacterales bacterium]